MEILGNHDQSTLFAKVKHKLYSRKTSVLVFTIFTFLMFGAGCVIYGAYLQKTGQTSGLKMLLIRVYELDFSFIPRYAQSTAAEVDELALDVKFMNQEKIRYLRERALAQESITEEIQEEVPAKIRYNGSTYRVGLSLTGMTMEHIKHPYKWSLFVKVKDGKTIMGMKKFALLYPHARGYLTDWIATNILSSLSVIGIRTDFVAVEVNGKNQGIYYLEERYDKRLIENNQSREGIVFKAWDNHINVYGQKAITESPELGAQLTRLKRAWYGLLSDDIQVQELFDLPKFAAMFAVSDLMSEKHPLNPRNMRLYYNPITGLVEPIGREWGFLRKEKLYLSTSLSIDKPDPKVPYHNQLVNIPLLVKIMEPFEFEEEYIKTMELISRPEFLDSLFQSKQLEIDLISDKVYKNNPFYKFPIEILRKNQEYLRKKLFPDFPAIKVYFDQQNQHDVSIHVENKVNLPIEIHSIAFNAKHFSAPSKRILLKSKFKQTQPLQKIHFQLSDSINSTNFSSDSLEVFYSILGINKIQSTIVYPNVMGIADYSKLIPTQQKSNFQEFEAIEYDPKNKIIKFLAPGVEIDKDLIIPDGHILIAEPGTEINFTNASRIISYSPVSFIGEPGNEINLTSSDSTGQGMVVFSAPSSSNLSYVNFDKLSNITDDAWVLRGVITFYESPVEIDNCVFSNNLNGDDYLNVIRTTFNITNTSFENTNADALDSDFCTGTLSNTRFINIGNDALDISGTKLEVAEVEIYRPADKGISAGERSYLKCYSINITGGEIAVAGKDDSIIEIENITINSSALAYCAFQKKPEYGEGKIKVVNSKVVDVKTEHLIEIGSWLSIDGKMIRGDKERVNDMLYGVEYGKSSK